MCDNEKNMYANRSAISADRNVIQSEKILTYKDITIEIQCTWNVKTNVIPVMEQATGTISKPFRK